VMKVPVFVLALTFVLFASAQNNTQFQITFPAGSVTSKDFNLPKNFVNPVLFTIVSQGVSQTQLCVQPNVVPYPGDFSLTCPSGSFATLNGSNTTTTASSVYGSRKSYSVYETTNKLLSSQSEALSNTTSEIYLIPGAPIYYAALETNFTTSDITIEISAISCPIGSFGSNCQTIPQVLTPSGIANVTINNGTWLFYSLPVSAQAGYATVTVNYNGGSGLYLYAQLGTLPTSKFNAQVFNSNSKNQLSFTVVEPYVAGSTWYIGIWNSGSSPITLQSINVTSNTCNSTTYGYSCSSISSIPIVAWNSTEGTDFSKVSNPQTSNNWGLLFMTINNSLIPNGADVFRFSVGPQSGVSSLQAYARFNGIPSPALYDFNGTMEYVSQFILSNPVNGNGQWYIGVVASESFVAWAGSNCLSCKDSGTCICDGQVCDATNQFIYPTSTNDSYGMCQCTSKDYDKSYNCSQNPDAFSPVYIVLIVIGGVIVIAVAIGVPLYCYVKSRKRSNYDTI